MWTWTCSGCGATFSRPEKTEAQQAFFDHVAEKHPRAVVLSMAADDTKES